MQELHLFATISIVYLHFFADIWIRTAAVDETEKEITNCDLRQAHTPTPLYPSPLACSDVCGILNDLLGAARRRFDRGWRDWGGVAAGFGRVHS